MFHVTSTTTVLFFDPLTLQHLMHYTIIKYNSTYHTKGPHRTRAILSAPVHAREPAKSTLCFVFAYVPSRCQSPRLPRHQTINNGHLAEKSYIDGYVRSPRCILSKSSPWHLGIRDIVGHVVLVVSWAWTVHVNLPSTCVCD